jgi:hypothetical protein
MRRIIIWFIGLLLCVVFVLCFWPIERAGDRWWSMPVTWKLVMAFVGICYLILAMTFCIDRYFKKRMRKPS